MQEATPADCPSIDPGSHPVDADRLRLLCDEMLKGVGRWLRAAGYDAAIVDDGAGDDALLARAHREPSTSRDRRAILEHADGDDRRAHGSLRLPPTSSCLPAIFTSYPARSSFFVVAGIVSCQR